MIAGGAARGTVAAASLHAAGQAGQAASDLSSTVLSRIKFRSKVRLRKSRVVNMWYVDAANMK